MIESLKEVEKDNTWSKCCTESIDCISDSGDDVGRCFEDVRPYKIEEMNKRIFASQIGHTERKMSDSRGSSLSMDRISVRECIFQKSNDWLDVVLCHLSNILEHKGERFQDTILNIQFLHPVLIHKSRKDCKRSARFRNDGNRDCSTHS